MHGLNGSYRCRAVNLFGSEFSDSASLDVLGKYCMEVARVVSNLWKCGTTEHGTAERRNEKQRNGIFFLFFFFFFFFFLTKQKKNKQ